MLEVISSTEPVDIVSDLLVHYPLNGNFKDLTNKYQDAIQHGSTGFTVPGSVPHSHLTYSICFWMRHQTTPTGSWDRNFLVRPSRQPGLWLTPTGNGVHFSTLMSGGVNVNTDVHEGGNAFPPNIWKHVILTSHYFPSNNTTVKEIFLDGIPRNRGFHNGSPSSPSGSLRFEPRGEYRDFRLYNRALTRSEVRRLSHEFNSVQL